MNPESITALRHAFRARPRPEKWLCEDLHPMDREDGVEFIEDIKNGGSSEKYFMSAIPYSAFLTVEAGVFLLPDFLATIVVDSSQAVAVLCHLQDERGLPVVLALTVEERAAVVAFIDSLEKSDDAAWMKEPLSELRALIQKEPIKIITAQRASRVAD